MAGRKKDPEKEAKEKRLAALAAQMKKWEEEEEYEKAHRIVQGAPRRPRKWATEVETPTMMNEDGTVQLTEPEWYIDENGREVQLITINTDWSLVDRYYPIENRYKYFAPPESLVIPYKESKNKPEPYKMKNSHTKIIQRPLAPGEKERDIYFNKFMKALEEKEEKIRSGKLITARPSFLWKNY